MAVEKIQFGAGIEVLIPKEKLSSGTKLYMAGPLGFAESTRPFHEKTIEIVRAMGGEVLDPWVLTKKSKIETVQKMPISPSAIKAWEELNREMGANNLIAIRKSTGVIANLDGVDVDSGTAAEIGAAFVLGKPIIGYRGDFRLSRDNLGGTVNLQVEHFIRESGGGKGNIIISISDLPKELLRIWG